MRRLLGFATLGIALLGAAAGIALAGSETPPEGPPWVRDFTVAQKAAVKRSVPVFVYLTKTH